VLGLAAGARPVGQNTRWFGLADALSGIGLDGLGRRKASWLAFRHGKYEYGIDSSGRGSANVESPAGKVGQPEGPIHMEEREFFNETTEHRVHSLICPRCGQAAEYNVTWIVRRKRAQVPRGADERDRARFAKAQSYMVRRDDKLQCLNIRCRKPFEITTLQSLAFLME
jgi:hypothetical protein